MPHTYTSKSQATNRTSCHALHRYQQITDNKSFISPCLQEIPANCKEKIVYLAMPDTDTSKSQATNRTSGHASYRYQQLTGNKSYILPSRRHRPCLIQHITCNKSCIYHASHSTSQATSRTSCHASHRYQRITGNKSFILPCKSQVTDRTSCHASHRYQQITGNKSYIISCLTQIPANQRQQIVHLAMPFTDTSDSQTTNRISYHASIRYQQITDNKSYILPCLIQIPANHRQQIVHLAMPHTDASESQQQISHH